MPFPFAPEAAEAVSNLAQKGVGKLEQSSMGRGLLNMTGNVEWEMDLTSGGQTAKAMLNEYDRLHDKALMQETQKLQAVRQWHQGDDAARNALPIKTATMGEYHAHAVAMGHPIQKVTGSILTADAENATLNQQQLMTKNRQIARLNGIAGSLGPNFENLTPIIAGMLKDPNPDIVQNAHRIADIVSNHVRDTKQVRDYQGVNQPTSAAKLAMNKAFGSANKVYEALEEKQIPMLSTEPTYEKQSEAERTSHRILDVAMLPFLGIKHVGQFFNISDSSPLSAIGASLLKMDHAEMEQTVQASSITASTLWSSMYRDIQGETGKVAEWTKSPTVGKILARSIHQPGFTWLRRQQLNMAGTVGFHSAIYWAHNFAESGSKIAEARLKEMEIDPTDVIKQGGKLNEEQLQRGVFHYTNNRMFFNKGIDNSLYQNRNIVYRVMFMYHSFVGSQTAHMRREVMMMAKAGDYKGLAQFAGTVAVLFPNIAPLLAGAEKLLTTGSAKQAQDETKQRYSRLYRNPLKDIPDWLENYATLLSHIGAAGVYFNYINAIKGHRLASALAGPMMGALTTDADDAFGAASGGSKAPLGRDALRQFVPVAGGALAHQLLPTKEESSGGSAASRSSRNKFRLRSLGRRR